MRTAFSRSQLVLAALLSLLVNVPVLLARTPTGRWVLLAVVLVLGLVIAIGVRRGAVRHESVRITGAGQVSGTVSSTDARVDVARFLRQVRRRQRLAAAWVPLVVLGLVVGSVLGAITLGWWGQLVLGAAGVVAVNASLLAVMLGAWRRLSS